jgi:hypothetical protein
MYSVRFKVGDFEQTQDFEIKIDPRIASSIPNVAAAYEERDKISKSIYQGAQEMAKGVRDLRKIKQQLQFVLGETNDASLQKAGEKLNKTIDDWIAEILQKELRTQQNNYMFEARLLVKFKGFLRRTGKGNLPVTQGTRDVAQDYLQQWAALKSRLSEIKNSEVPEINQRLEALGLPELYWPKQ